MISTSLLGVVGYESLRIKPVRKKITDNHKCDNYVEWSHTGPHSESGNSRGLVRAFGVIFDDS